MRQSLVLIFLTSMIAFASCNKSMVECYDAFPFDVFKLREKGMPFGRNCFVDMNRGIQALGGEDKTYLYTTDNGAREWRYLAEFKGCCENLEQVGDSLILITRAKKSGNSLFRVYKSGLDGFHFIEVETFKEDSRLAGINGFGHWGRPPRVKSLLGGGTLWLLKDGIIYKDRKGNVLKEYDMEIPSGTETVFIGESVLLKDQQDGRKVTVLSQSDSIVVDPMSFMYAAGADGMLLVGGLRGVVAYTFDGCMLEEKGTVCRDADVPLWVGRSGNLTFALLRKHSMSNPWLGVFLSRDCGRTWECVSKELKMRGDHITIPHILPSAIPGGFVFYLPEGKVYRMKCM